MKKLTRHKLLFVLTLLVTIVLIGSVGYLFYNVFLLKDIENEIRFAGSALIGTISILFIILILRFLKK